LPDKQGITGGFFVEKQEITVFFVGFGFELFAEKTCVQVSPGRQECRPYDADLRI